MAARRPGVTAGIRVIRGPDVLSDLGIALDELHDATSAPVMARRVWLENWMKCYQDHEPWAIALDADRGIEAVALLARRRRRGINEIVRMGHGATDDARLPARDAACAEILAEAVALELECLPRPWALYLGQLPVDDPVAHGIARRLRHADLVPGDGSPVARFGVDRSLRAHVSRNFIKSHRNALNRLRKEGMTVHISHLRNPDDIARVLPKTDAVRRKRDAAKGWHNKLADPQYASFRQAVVFELARRGEIELTVTQIGDVLAAYDLALLDEASYRLWDGRFSPEWARFSPGRLSLKAILTRALADLRFRELDFMRGRHEYKLSIANHVVPSETLVAWSSPLVQAMATSAKRLKRALKATRAAVRH